MQNFPTAEATVLDIGTGTGTNLKMLRDLGYAEVSGLDRSPAAIAYCESRGLGAVRQGDVCALPFEADSFDLVLATDVIEHVDDDGQALQEIHRVLAPGGRAIITVPAFQSLWGKQDELSHHRRRYRKRQLLRLIDKSGLVTTRSYYFNFILFPVIWLARKTIAVLNLQIESENQVNTAFLNRLLYGLFLVDINTAPLVRPPFGVSILANTRKSS